MRLRAWLALSAVVGLASAATVVWADPPDSPSTPPQPQAPASAAPAGNTVSGVTVIPLPSRSCKPKDKACIALVIAELKRQYPEQLKRFCFDEQVMVMRQDMQASIAGWCDSPKQGALALCNHYVPPVVKQACASDPKPANARK